MADLITKKTRTKNYVELNKASVIMGIIVIILCIFDLIPKEFSRVLLYLMPLLLIVNYAALHLLYRSPAYSINV
jgi:hypothetical protein